MSGRRGASGSTPGQWLLHGTIVFGLEIGANREISEQAASRDGASPPGVRIAMPSACCRAMAVLWLHATAALFAPAPKINLELKRRVRGNLERWASWPAEGSPVLWTDRPAGAGVRETDCVVYFVPTYREGVIVGRTRRDPKFSAHHYALLQQLSLGDPAHLSATIADPPAMSEVWVMDMMRWVRESRAANPIWT